MCGGKGQERSMITLLSAESLFECKGGGWSGTRGRRVGTERAHHGTLTKFFGYVGAHFSGVEEGRMVIVSSGVGMGPSKPTGKLYLRN